jgi:hypothetical protein
MDGALQYHLATLVTGVCLATIGLGTLRVNPASIGAGAMVLGGLGVTSVVCYTALTGKIQDATPSRPAVGGMSLAAVLSLVGVVLTVV